MSKNLIDPRTGDVSKMEGEYSLQPVAHCPTCYEEIVQCEHEIEAGSPEHEALYQRVVLEGHSYMKRERLDVIRCPYCGQVFWINNATKWC